MARIASIMSLALVAFAAVMAEAADTVKTEVDGVWELVAYNKDGKDDEATIAKKYVVTRAEGQQTVTKGGEEVRKSRFTIDTKATPKTITFPATEKESSMTIGIYSVDGNSMKIAIFSDVKKNDTEHPKNFEPAADKIVATYRKIK